jgi:hypothetical protein
MRLLVLKTAATLVAVGATVVSSLYVTAHLKNPSAPLRPAVLNSNGTGTVSLLGRSVSVGPSVQPTTTPPVTSTYAS